VEIIEFQQAPRIKQQHRRLESKQLLKIKKRPVVAFLFFVKPYSKIWNIPKKMGQRFIANPLILLAEWTGLEPATPGVTGRYSNQLNYHS
jgi:hypothetical protein